MSNTPDKDELAEIRDVFNHFDKDDNGVIDPQEFGKLCRALDGGFGDSELDAGLSAVDTNHNGKIEFDEFVAWWTQR